MASNEALRMLAELADQMEHKPDACCGWYLWVSALDARPHPYCIDCPRREGTPK